MTDASSGPGTPSLLADENVRGEIIRGLRHHTARLDLIGVHDVGLAQADDRTILEWAAAQGRVVLTHDEQTMIGYAYERIKAGLPMPGVVVIQQDTPVGVAIESLLVLLEVGTTDDCHNKVLHLPF